jgi:hypothetical protein
MRAAHCMNQLCQEYCPASKCLPHNTTERAVWTAENGSTRDSSEAVQTAVRAAVFKGKSCVTVFTNFLSQVSQSC